MKYLWCQNCFHLLLVIEMIDVLLITAAQRIALYRWNKYTFAAKGKPVILLLFNAGPLDITWAKMNPGVYVIMECFFPAQATGWALARTFMNQGEAAVPAGRLPATWPTNLQQVAFLSFFRMTKKLWHMFQVN